MTSAWESLDKIDDGEAFKKWMLNIGITPGDYNDSGEGGRKNLRKAFQSHQQSAVSNKKRRMDGGEGPKLIGFSGHIKKCLEIGKLSKKFGGLLDRESSIDLGAH